MEGCFRSLRSGDCERCIGRFGMASIGRYGLVLCLVVFCIYLLIINGFTGQEDFYDLMFALLLSPLSPPFFLENTCVDYHTLSQFELCRVFLSEKLVGRSVYHR